MVPTGETKNRLQIAPSITTRLVDRVSNDTNLNVILNPVDPTPNPLFLLKYNSFSYLSLL